MANGQRRSLRPGGSPRVRAPSTTRAPRGRCGRASCHPLPQGGSARSTVATTTAGRPSRRRCARPCGRRCQSGSRTRSPPRAPGSRSRAPARAAPRRPDGQEEDLRPVRGEAGATPGSSSPADHQANAAEVGVEHGRVRPGVMPPSISSSAGSSCGTAGERPVARDQDGRVRAGARALVDPATIRPSGALRERPGTRCSGRATARLPVRT